VGSEGKLLAKKSSFKLRLLDVKAGRGFRASVMWCCIVRWVFFDISLFTILGTTHPKLQCHTPEDKNPKQTILQKPEILQSL